MSWAMTMDCDDPERMGRFWAQALGYVPAPPPRGYQNWEEWFDAFDVPLDERSEMAALIDPDGMGPALSLLAVPEAKSAKNRLHLDLKVSGGRHVEWEQRWPVVLAAVDRLTAAGATVIATHELHGREDHVVMGDPEGNEFCVI